MDNHLEENKPAVAQSRAEGANSNEGLGKDAIARVLLEKVVHDLRRENGALQAKIDRIMLEYCHDEMTEEQRENWGMAQRTARVPNVELTGAEPRFSAERPVERRVGSEKT